MGNPSSTREHRSTASSTFPKGQIEWGFRSRLGLPQAIPCSTRPRYKQHGEQRQAESFQGSKNLGGRFTEASLE